MNDFSDCEVVSLAYSDPRIKPKMMLALVKESLGSGHPVEYIDFDLQFSSLLQSLSDDQYNEISDELLRVFQPGPNVIDFVAPLFNSGRKGGLIVIDSLNTAQNLLSQEPTAADLKLANHRAAIFISALQQFARANSQTILLLNLTKLRPKRGKNSEILWEKEIVGGRMTRFKSDVILFVSQSILHSESIRIEVKVGSIVSEAFGGYESDEYELQFEH